MTLAVYIGWDPRETEAYDVCEFSLRSRSGIELDIRPIKLQELRSQGLYNRPTEFRDARLWDVISEAPMSTEFAISRFFVPLLAQHHGIKADWALFCDCDFLWLGDIAELQAEADPNKALCCVQHQYEVKESVKMDGQAQMTYARKNWSSLMLFNLRSKSHEKLTLDVLNGVPGRDLHRFCWLRDDELQPLSIDWNWLEGAYTATETPPRAIHFTRGGPWMVGWEHVNYAELWRKEFRSLSARGAKGGACRPR